MAAKARPDLRVTRVSAVTVGTAGERIGVGVRVANSGRARARSSTARLSGPRGAIVSFSIPALRPGRSFSRTLRIVPPTGSYSLLACADVRRRVAERSERNNCARTRRVSIAPVPQPPALFERPSDLTNSTTARFVFGGGSSFECSLDGGAFSACTSPVAHAGLGEGRHDFQVRALDADGRRSLPAIASWVIDITPPAAPRIAEHPAALTNSAASAFRLETEPGARLFCRINDSEYFECNRTPSWTLPEGTYEFAVRATDSAGNEGARSSHRWRIDLTAPPAPVVTERPPVQTYVRSARIAFSFPAASEPVTRDCRLDGAAVPCDEALVLAGPIAAGTHRLTLATRDEAGNEARTSVEWTLLARGDGAYAGPGGIAPVAAFATWRGSPVTHALDYLRRVTWQDIEGSSAPDIVARWRGSPYRLVLSTPMLPESGATLLQGSTGLYNVHFDRLARKLVAEGHGNAVIRLGWEFNGNWFPWSPVKEPNGAESFKAFWRQIVTTMRAVSPHFEFDWCMNSGPNGMADASDAYPGGDFVDFIGLSAFDAAWGAPPSGATPEWRWGAIRDQKHGLAWQRDFAAAHDKRMTYPEWGLWKFIDPGYYEDGGSDGQDDPYYVQSMFEWLNANEVAYALYFDWDSDVGLHALSNFPNGRERYRQLFGSLR